MATILPVKSNVKYPMALDDEHHEALANDPTIPEFPPISNHGPTRSNINVQLPDTSSSIDSLSGRNSTNSFVSTAVSNFSELQQQPSQFQQNQVAAIQSSGGAMQEGAQITIDTNDVFGNWINKRWRPLFATMYLVACTCDFVLFPILWSILQAISNGQVTSQWAPLTIQGGGLFHIACGAVLGVAAYGRTQEKIAGKS